MGASVSGEKQRIAVVDFGTNSTRLLVADVANGAVEELERRTDVTRLGEGVDRSGRLGDAAMERVFETVAGYREVIDGLGGVSRAIGVATSAVRDSANRDAFRVALSNRYGIDVEVLAGEEEARLTFLGATAARPSGDSALVIDIGGGSTEYVVGTPAAAPSFRVSTELGSVRQTERHLESDPPSDDEVSALEAEANEILNAEVPSQIREEVSAGVAVAGTATSLAAIDLELEPYDPERVHGHRLEADTCRRLLGQLAAVPVAQRRETRGLHPDRAPTIVAGAAILLQSIVAFGLDSIEVSEADILHGAALEVAGGEA